MIESEYYKNYQGPELIKCMFNNEDITIKIKKIYGEKNNWSGCLWTYKEIFGTNSKGKNFRCDFKSENGREHWFHGFILDINQYMNPPLSTPMNQIYSESESSK